MKSTVDARSALRELFQFHYAPHIWPPALFVFVAVGAFVLLLGQVLYVGAGPDLVPGAFSITYRNVGHRLLVGHDIQRVRWWLCDGAALRTKCLRIIIARKRARNC